jgi:two-component system response regulator GlrR
MSGLFLLVDSCQKCFETALDGYGLASLPVSWRTVTPDFVFKSPTLVRDADLLLVAAMDHPEPALRFLTRFAEDAQRAPTLAVVGDHAPPALLAAVSEHADDFVVWRPGGGSELCERIRRALGDAADRAATSRHLTDSVALARLIGRDPAFVAMVARIPVVAKASGAALIMGETGTGKELCARALHHLSPRRNHPFVPVDCAALPEQLLENELFGHKRGAFTDAHSSQTGLVAMAEGGTLFLDEVDSLSPSAQAKLLRLLEDRSYRPLGGDRFLQADIRVLAATNRDLETLVRQQRFRSDLYFRLNVFQLKLPPLRERRGDIPLLAQHFVNQICAEAGQPRKRLAPAAIERLRQADWPGNAREMLNVLQCAVAFCNGATILVGHLELPEPDAPGDALGRFRDARARAVERFERSYIETLLRKHAGNVTRSALEAQKDRRAFGRLIKKYRIDRLIM